MNAFIVLGAAIALAFASWLGWIVSSALQSGRAVIAGGREFSRKRKPLAYWTIVGVQTGFALTFLFLAIRRLITS